MVLNRHFALQLLSGLRLSWGFPDRDLLREMRTFGLHALVWNTASFITMYSDSIIVSRIFGPTAASRYYATTAPAQWGSNAIMRLMATAVPGVNQLLALNDGIALRATYARLIRYSCGLAVALSSCLLVINRDVISVWLGDSLYGGGVLNGIQCLYTVWIVIKGVQYSFLVTFGRSKILTVTTVSDAAVKLLLSIYLGRKYGIAGVAAATLLSSFFCTSWAWSVLWHDLGRGAGRATLWQLGQTVPLGALMATAGWVLKASLANSDVWLRLAVLAGFLLCGWMVIAACHILGPIERNTMVRWIARPGAHQTTP
jgi:O-antigen/teichoic acid export membrane protein